MLNEAETLTALEALAQETRLRTVRALVTVFPKGLAAGQLAQDVGRSPATLTFHLRLLEHAGLVQQRRQARSVIYTAVPERLIGLVDGLMKGCCGGRSELRNSSYPDREIASQISGSCEARE